MTSLAAKMKKSATKSLCGKWIMGKCPWCYQVL